MENKNRTYNSFILLLIGISSLFIYITYKPFLVDIMIATLLIISLNRPYIYLNDKLKNYKYKENIIAILLSFLLIITLLIPLIYSVISLTGYLSNIDMNYLKTIVVKTKTLLLYFPEDIQKFLNPYLNLEIIKEYYVYIVSFFTSITTKSAVFIKDLLLIITFFYFFVLYFEKIKLFFIKLLPINLSSLYNEVSNTLMIVLYSTLIISLLEGVLFGLICNVYKLDFITFTIIYAIMSLIPVIGGIIVWGPVSLYFYSIGNTNASLTIILYSIIIISIITDTFIKPLIIEKIKNNLNVNTSINSIFIFFSMIAGLSSFGFWGIIIGPAITTIFISILKYYL